MKTNIHLKPQLKRNSLRAIKLLASAKSRGCPDRAIELDRIFKLSVRELVAKSGGHLVVKETLPELYDFLAEEMVAEFQKAMGKEGPTAFIMPVGPTQPYKLMAEKINQRRISLKNCHFFFMDEYCDDNDKLISKTHPLSFRGQIGGLFFNLVDPKLLMPESQRIFPTPQNLAKLPGMIAKVGGIEVCYGGIGIHGHLAFNEPEPGVRDRDPRILTINDFTRTLDSTRHGLGGNLVKFPRRAITLGMRQCLGARRVLVMTRNVHECMDWANTVLRISVLGAPGDDYPVTYLRDHPNYQVATDRATATAPRIII
jgi:glucosamine-6-phosphate deaminase